MKAVARLMLAYFTGTRLLLVVTVLGAIACVGGTAALLFLPPLVAQYNPPWTLPFMRRNEIMIPIRM